MDMKVYIADRKSGKQLYKRTKKLYKRYKYGTLIMTGILLIMIVLDLWMIWRTEDRSHLGGTLILCFGADILFIIAAVLARAAAISGGREVLMSRLAEKCFFTDDSFVLEYIPNPHETTAYECIRFQMKHRELLKAVCEERFGRLALYGSYRVFKYRTQDSENGMDSYVISDMPLYVYGYYREFDTIKERLRKMAPKWEIV